MAVRSKIIVGVEILASFIDDLLSQALMFSERYDLREYILVRRCAISQHTHPEGCDEYDRQISCSFAALPPASNGTPNQVPVTFSLTKEGRKDEGDDFEDSTTIHCFMRDLDEHL